MLDLIAETHWPADCSYAIATVISSQAIILTQVLGLSYADASVVSGCAIGTIRSRVARAREDLLSVTAGAGTERTKPSPSDHRCCARRALTKSSA